MPSPIRSIFLVKALDRLGLTNRTLSAVGRALKAGPPPETQLELHLIEARAAIRRGKLNRTLLALERGFALAEETGNPAATSALAQLFDELAAGTLTSRGARLGDVHWFTLPGRKADVVLQGLCTDVSSNWARSPIRLLLEGSLVSEVHVRPLTGGQGRGQFEFRPRESLLAQLGPNAIELELDGVRYPVPKSLFAELWPGDRTTTSDEVHSRLARGSILDSNGNLALPKNQDDAWLRPTFELYGRARAWLAETLGYELYLTGGTLLGYARTGEVISFDKDFDTGYVSRHTEPDAIRREFKEIIIGLLRAGGDVRLLSTKNPTNVRRDYFWYGAGRHHIDIFPGAFIGGKYRRPTFVDTELTREDFFPFAVKEMNGFEVVVPREIEKKVAAVYGPGWKTPDPFWKKVRSPAIQAYREQLMLTNDDLLEIAAVSPHEGERLRQLVERS